MITIRSSKIVAIYKLSLGRIYFLAILPVLNIWPFSTLSNLLSTACQQLVNSLSTACQQQFNSSSTACLQLGAEQTEFRLDVLVMAIPRQIWLKLMLNQVHQSYSFRSSIFMYVICSRAMPSWHVSISGRRSLPIVCLGRSCSTKLLCGCQDFCKHSFIL